uniref:ATP synthase complex subunit 8 n=1 Tax=Gymnotus carapo TaxID=94172 RepID=F7UIA6_9TELE|nr:ATPase subunit 8 [Gymnotus carapo]
MPQLNPSPWFSIMFFSWLIFLLIIMPMTLKYTFPNEPANTDTKTPNTTSWAWPWF